MSMKITQLSSYSSTDGQKTPNFFAPAAREVLRSTKLGTAIEALAIRALLRIRRIV